MNIMALKNSKLHTVITNVMVFVLFFTIGFWSYRLNVRTEDSSARTVPSETTAIDLSLSPTAAGELAARVSIEADYQLVVSTSTYTEQRLNPQEATLTFTETQAEPVTITAVASE